jgi:hypothetical protein
MNSQASLFPEVSKSSTASAKVHKKVKLSRTEKVQLIRSKIQQGKERSDLFTINSISGGRSSAYMAYHNRADLNIFSIVSTDDPRCRIIDPAILTYVWDKCGTDLVYATLESDDTIKSVMELEQFMGEEIFFTYGNSLDSIIADRKYLPNQRSRFCTVEMKLKPIFDFLHLKARTSHNYYDSEAYGRLEDYYRSLTDEDRKSPYYRVNIGYRVDDYERIETFSESHKHVVGIHDKGRNVGQRRWEEVNWRVGNFPIFNKTQQEVIDFWKGKEMSFPEFNNCEFCFHRSPAALKKQLVSKPRKAVFWKKQEEIMGASFHKDYTLEEIEKLEFSQDIDYTAENSCNSGGCTD